MWMAPGRERVVPDRAPGERDVSLCSHSQPRAQRHPMTLVRPAGPPEEPIGGAAWPSRVRTAARRRRVALNPSSRQGIQCICQAVVRLLPPPQGPPGSRFQAWGAQGTEPAPPSPAEFASKPWMAVSILDGARWESLIHPGEG